MRNYLEYHWNNLLDITGDDHFRAYVVIPNVVTILTFWIVSLAFMVLDLMPRTKLIRKFKVQPFTHDPLEIEKLPSIIKVSLFNQFFVQIPFVIAMHPLVLWRMDVETEFVRAIPPLWKIAFDFVACEIIREIVFYYAHRLIHHPRFYKKYHKMHHEWTSPIAMASIYCHPVEMVIVDVFPLMVGPLILASSPVTVAIWHIHTLFRTVYDHSGYNFPLYFYNSEQHDFHHMRFNSCFGFLGLMDWVVGTDGDFRKFKEELKTK